ncbi:MAG: glycosyltransferase family 2 protein [Deltaproteobacteria bacterium]|nr:glycosyltransferase family 2 protein [Deltaproteobacteria bacterium]
MGKHNQYFKIQKDTLPDYWKILSWLYAAFGREAVTCLIPDPSRNRREQVLTALGATLGLEPKLSQELAASFTPRFSCLLPREVAYFAGISNFERTGPAIPGTLMRWSPQVRRFTPESGYTGSPHSLLGPRLRAEILAGYAASNAEAAALLGLDRLFPEPEPEPDWEPWSGLTPEVASKVAARLEADFVRELLKPFAGLPAHCQTREQRLVHQALLQALPQALPGVSAPAGSPAPRIIPEKPPKLSVLTLAYNQADYIGDCIEGVLAQQTNFPFQHIIADDASDDGTQEIILDYAAKHPHILPIFQRTRSFGPGNVHALFDMARTEYAALCDGDDYFTDPLKLQTQADFLDAHPDCGLCFHPVRVLYENAPEKEGIYPPPEGLPRGVRRFYYLSELVRANMIQTNSVMYRWRFRQGLPQWFRSDLMPGDWYWHLLHAEKGKIGFINKIMSVYRRQAGGVYALSAKDKLRHRNKVALAELETYKVINEHFQGQFETFMFGLARTVFLECLRYKRQGRGDAVFDKLAEKYPELAEDFSQFFVAYNSTLS